MNVSAWLGVNEYLTSKYMSDPRGKIDMYSKWPFGEVIHLIAMIPSRNNFSITANYDIVFVDIVL